MTTHALSLSLLFPFRLFLIFAFSLSLSFSLSAPFHLLPDTFFFFRQIRGWHYIGLHRLYSFELCGDEQAMGAHAASRPFP